jgi:hypothetical protein
MTGLEARRLGLDDSARVRVRQVPDDHWENRPYPPDLAPYVGRPIPEDLRGRTGVVEHLGHKYGQVADVRLDRRSREEPYAVIKIPLIWLEKDLTTKKERRRRG